MTDTVSVKWMHLVVRTVEIRMFEKASNVTVHLREVAPISCYVEGALLEIQCVLVLISFS